MATLVQFLAAGVNGAASGSATFLLRGTASTAQPVMYNEFEGLTQPATNVVTLDANGAAEVYVDAYVDVEIKNSAGTTLRTVTVGNSAPLVEVQSTSFTGTDYDGAPANTVGEPITLKAILDKWITSAGASNWQVLSNGVATNLQTALASVAGIFVNVKDPAYGATGDGVTDDTTAILAAHSAAAGGIVFFPAGTYKMTTGSPSGANLNWLGAGAGASIISGSTSTTLLQLTDNTVTGWKNFTGLSFTSSGTYDQLFVLEETQNVTFSRCTFDGTNCTVAIVAGSAAPGLSKYLFTDCDFNLAAATPLGIFNAAPTASRHLSIKGCNFKVPAGFTGTILAGTDMVVDGCLFDARAVVSGVYRHIDAEDDTITGRYVGSFTNNKFMDGGSTGFVFKLTGLGSSCDFSEDGNTFIGFTAPAATLEKGQTYEITDAESGIPGDVHLGSRKGRVVHITLASSTITVSACLEAESVVIERTGGTSVTATVPALIPGLSGRIVVFTANGQAEGSKIFVDSGGFGVFVRLDNGAEEEMTTQGGGDEAISCSYWTTVRNDGVFRSLITSEVSHHS